MAPVNGRQKLLSRRSFLAGRMPRRGLEPPRPKGTGPQPAAYANSATGALFDSRIIRLSKWAVNLLAFGACMAYNLAD